MNSSDKLRAHCQEHGQRFTKQKEAIYLALLSDQSHPTADEIYSQVQRKHPKISFATVYDNLKKLTSMGLVQEVNCGGNCRRFEARMDTHHHVIDTRNQRVLDVHLDEGQEIPIPKSLQGKNIKEIKISYVL